MKRDFAYTIEGACLAGDRLVRRRVAVCGGRVEHGQGQAILWRLPPEQVLIPAFHDHHTHLVGTFRPPMGPALQAAASRGACLEAVAHWLRAHPGSSPVLGEGWDESAWDDPRTLTRAELDSVAPNRPVALRRVCGHIAVANSAAWTALEPAGDEADPETGRLVESLALGLSRRWPASSADYVRGASLGQDAAARAGVAGLDEMGRTETYRAFARLAEDGALWLHVRHFLPLDSLDELQDEGIRAGAGMGTLRVTGLKGFLDGSFGARTAAVDAPYSDRGGMGMLLWDTARLNEAVRRGSQAGFTIALHAIGARAIDQAVTALEQAAPAPPGCPHRIEHAEQITQAAIGRARAAGIALSMQPNFTARWQGPGGMYETALGRDRARHLNPYRAAAGATALLFGSDTMPFGVLDGLPGALAHPDPGHRLSAAEAIAAYTRHGLRMGGMRDLLVPGAGADVAVLDVPGADLDRALRERAARVIWTAAAGRTVWHADDAGVPHELIEAAA